MKLNYAGEFCHTKKSIIIKKRKLLTSEMGGSEYLDLSSIPIGFCPDSNLNILIFLSVTPSNQYGQGVLPVEILDPIKTIYKPWSIFLEKWRDRCIVEIQLLEDRRGLSGIIFKAKREGLGNYLYFDIWKSFIYQAFVIHQVFKVQVWKLMLSFQEWPLSNCSNFLLCLSNQPAEDGYSRCDMFDCSKTFIIEA